MSTQTVSRVVNGSDNVAQEIRQRVEGAVSSLGYRPHRAARALATSRSMSIGVVGYGLEQYGPSVALNGIVEEARIGGYGTNLVALPDVNARSMRYAVEHLVNDSVDGIVMLAPLAAAEEAVRAITVPFHVVSVQPGRPSSVDSVVTDDIAGAAAVTAHLAKAGGTVHHLAGPVGWLASVARIEGWLAALAAAGRPAPPVARGDWSARAGYEAGSRWALEPGVTSVFAANDQMAFGVLKAMADHGRHVPGDVQVAGFDDVPGAAFARPGLTTVRVDFEQVGRSAVRQMLALLEGTAPGGVALPEPLLVVRESTHQ